MNTLSALFERHRSPLSWLAAPVKTADSYALIMLIAFSSPRYYCTTWARLLHGWRLSSQFISQSRVMLSDGVFQGLVAREKHSIFIRPDPHYLKSEVRLVDPQ